MKLKHLLLVPILAIVILNACLKNSTSKGLATSEDDKAVVAWIESQKQVFKTDGQWIDSVENSLDFSHEVMLSFDTLQDLVIIPLRLSFVRELHNSVLVDATQITLMILKDKQGNVMSGKILALTSAKAYAVDYIVRLQKSSLNDERKFEEGFTGALTLLKLNKSLVSYSLYSNGKYTQKTTLRNEGGLSYLGTPKHKNVELGTTQPETETCTDWYTVTYNYETYEIISVVFDYTECTSTGNGGAGGSNGSDESVTEWETGVADAPSSHLCTNNYYNFTVTGNAYSATINLLGIQLFGPGGQWMNIELGSVCLSMPSYGINQITASINFVEAWNIAVDDITTGLNNGSILPKSFLVQQKLKAFLLQNLTAFTPGTTISTGNGCAGSVVQNNAVYC
jgi:hypothetical protein